MTWINKYNNIVSSMADMPEGCFGFIYRIDNHDQLDEEGNSKFYIGKKQCISVTKKKFGKKKMAAITDKRAKTYEMIAKESNWKTYNSSNVDLRNEIKDGANVTKTILEYAQSKYHLTYLEVKHQFLNGVLETEHSYNDSILGKFFRSVFDFNKR